MLISFYHIKVCWECRTTKFCNNPQYKLKFSCLSMLFGDNCKIKPVIQNFKFVKLQIQNCQSKIQIIF